MTPNTAAAAYSKTSRDVGTPRSIEYQAFQKATAALTAAADPETPFPNRAEAVYANTKLWLVLECDLLSEKNKLPKPLRAQLVNLARFVRSHSSQALSKDGDIQTLIDINTSIMRGLRGIAPDTLPGRETAQPPMKD